MGVQAAWFAFKENCKFAKREKVWKKGKSLEKRENHFIGISPTFISLDGTVKLILMKTSKLSPSTLYNLEWDTGGGI